MGSALGRPWVEADILAASGHIHPNDVRSCSSVLLALGHAVGHKPEPASKRGCQLDYKLAVTKGRNPTGSEGEGKDARITIVPTSRLRPCG